MAKAYDVIVIGTGVAGTTVAYEFRSAGSKVAVVDYRAYGGTCPLRGCDPKKVLVGAAEVADRSQDLKGKGISRESEIDWPELMKFKRTFTDPIPQSMEKGFANAGIDTLHGQASFTGKNTMRVGDQALEGKHIVIATGAQPMKLDIPGEEYLTTSEQFLEMPNMPESIVFVGGGYISFEFAHIAARAGADVTILHRSASPIKKFDPDLVAMLIKASEELGIKVRLNVPVHLIEKKEGKFVVHTGEDEAYESDIAVHGAGRVPELAGLDLEKGGVEVDRKGIVVNEYLQSISNPLVYVAGDANARGVALTPVATMEGRTVAKNILEGNNTKVDYAAIPSVVFTLPPMASVGMQEEDAEKLGLKYEKNYKDSSSWYTSRRIGLKHSGVKVLIDRENNRVLGAHLLGHNAEEIINIFALAIKANLSIDVLRQMVWTYPTSSSDISYMI